jgi:hypothetical protein
MRHNLFRFATSELSHSAFWAWTLQSLDSSDDALTDVRMLASEFLKRIGIRNNLTSPIEVETEVGIGEGQRIDIRVRDASGLVIAIENKVKAIPTKNQLDKYQDSLGPLTRCVFLSTAFHPDVIIPSGWQPILLEDLVKLVLLHPTKHPLLQDYKDWLIDLSEKKFGLQQDALSNDAAKQTHALSQAEGQWALVEFLTKSMDGRQYRGTNIGGKLWTQFRFTSDDQSSPGFDALFYRIDIRQKRYVLSLAQYQTHPSPCLKAKVARFHMLQDLWLTAWKEESRSIIQPIVRKARESKETEILRFVISEVPPTVLREPLLRTHKAFVEKITAKGWSIFR